MLSVSRYLVAHSDCVTVNLVCLSLPIQHFLCHLTLINLTSRNYQGQKSFTHKQVLKKSASFVWKGNMDEKLNVSSQQCREPDQTAQVYMLA